MKLVLIALLCTVAAGSAWARLGDTRDQAEGRYGLEKHEGQNQFQNSLLHGCKDITFEYEGWSIRCALLRATDGNEYVVREEYRKIWNTAIYKAGGTLMIRDFERDAVIQAEGGNLWVQQSGNAGTELYSSLINHFTHLAGVTGKMWTRSDGAVARTDAVGTSIELASASAKRVIENVAEQATKFSNKNAPITIERKESTAICIDGPYRLHFDLHFNAPAYNSPNGSFIRFGVSRDDGPFRGAPGKDPTPLRRSKYTADFDAGDAVVWVDEAA